MLQDLTLRDPIRFSGTKVRDLKRSELSSTVELLAQFTWPKSSAPDELWSWREFAKPFAVDPSVSEKEGGRVERWIVKRGPFANRQMFRRRRVDGQSVFEEEVGVTFRCDMDSPREYDWLQLTVSAPATLAPLIFDSLKATTKTKPNVWRRKSS